jgi:hypothetical protein
MYRLADLRYQARSRSPEEHYRPEKNRGGLEMILAESHAAKKA